MKNFRLPLVPSIGDLLSKTTEVNGCLEWTGSRTSQGYGQLVRNRKAIGVHRMMFELSFGKIKSGHSICHKCDNPPCINPDHLFSGTHLDNMIDSLNKGRLGSKTLPGSKNHQAKLSDKKVIEIRKKYMNGNFSQRRLAKIYKVSKSAITWIVTGKHWTHLLAPEL